MLFSYNAYCLCHTQVRRSLNDLNYEQADVGAFDFPFFDDKDFITDQHNKNTTNFKC